MDSERSERLKTRHREVGCMANAHSSGTLTLLAIEERSLRVLAVRLQIVGVNIICETLR